MPVSQKILEKRSEAWQKKLLNSLFLNMLCIFLFDLALLAC